MFYSRAQSKGQYEQRQRPHHNSRLVNDGHIPTLPWLGNGMSFHPPPPSSSSSSSSSKCPPPNQSSYIGTGDIRPKEDRRIIIFRPRRISILKSQDLWTKIIMGDGHYQTADISQLYHGPYAGCPAPPLNRLSSAPTGTGNKGLFNYHHQIVRQARSASSGCGTRGHCHRIGDIITIRPWDTRNLHLHP